MRRVLVSLVLLALLSPWSVAAQVRDLVGATFQARVVAVVDGDTVDAVPLGERRRIRIRLEGVDTPERGEPFSDAARRFTRVLMFDQVANVDGRDVDRYGRLVARISVSGTDSSLALVKAGLACHFVQYSDDDVLARAQWDASGAGRGFWAPGARTPRCIRSTSVRNPADTPSDGGAVLFRGNTSSRVYHAPTCRNYTCRNCTRLFTSAEEAAAAGFRPAGDCLGR